MTKDSNGIELIQNVSTEDWTVETPSGKVKIVSPKTCMPVNLKNSIIFVPIEVDNYDYTGRNIAVPAL